MRVVPAGVPLVGESGAGTTNVVPLSDSARYHDADKSWGPIAEEEAIQGVWDVINIEKGNGAQGDIVFKGIDRVTCESGIIAFENAKVGRTSRFHVVRTDPTASPKTIDLGGPPAPPGETSIPVLRGIYERTDTQLRICLARNWRPTSFGAKPESDVVMLTLERRKGAPGSDSVAPSSDAARHPNTGRTSGIRADDVPKLRFLAWQDEWKEWANERVWHADGTPVADKSESKLQASVPPALCDISRNTQLAKENPRFLNLWFSQPDFDRQSCLDVVLLDAEGKLIPLAAGGMMASRPSAPAADNGNLGWITYTLSPGPVGHTPKVATIRLKYMPGRGVSRSSLEPDFHGVCSLPASAMLSGIGQNAAGKAFVSVARDIARDR